MNQVLANRQFQGGEQWQEVGQGGAPRGGDDSSEDEEARTAGSTPSALSTAFMLHGRYMRDAFCPTDTLSKCRCVP